MQYVSHLVPPRYQVCAVFCLAITALVIALSLVNWMFSD